MLGWLTGRTPKLNRFNVKVLTMNRWFLIGAAERDLGYAVSERVGGGASARERSEGAGGAERREGAESVVREGWRARTHARTRASCVRASASASCGRESARARAHVNESGRLRASRRGCARVGASKAELTEPQCASERAIAGSPQRLTKPPRLPPPAPQPIVRYGEGWPETLAWFREHWLLAYRPTSWWSLLGIARGTQRKIDIQNEGTGRAGAGEEAEGEAAPLAGAKRAGRRRSGGGAK